MSELKPCPFCGEKPEIMEIDNDALVSYFYYEVVCKTCGLSNDSIYTNRHKVKDAAIAHWNTRPIEDALQARIAELEAMSEEREK